MARTRSLQDMIADVRHKSNFEDSEFLDDDEITEWLNQELAELHARLTANEGQPHFRTQQNISVVAGTALYALNSDFWRLQEVTGLVDGRSFPMHPFMPVERAELLNTQSYASLSIGQAPMYRIQANNIEVLPATRAFTMRVFYVQRSPRLVDPTDVVDGFDGYEVAAVDGAVATALEKENPGSGAFYQGRKDRLLKFIDSLENSRDASHPERVQDVVGLDAYDTFYPFLRR